MWAEDRTRVGEADDGDGRAHVLNVNVYGSNTSVPTVEQHWEEVLCFNAGMYG
jgi:hypothetical protein